MKHYEVTVRGKFDVHADDLETVEDIFNSIRWPLASMTLESIEEIRKSE
jgi:hypothetical protein